MSSTVALAVVLQPWWPQPLARVPLALRDLMALSCCSRALRVDGLDGLLLLKKMLDHWNDGSVEELEQGAGKGGGEGAGRARKAKGDHGV